MRSCFVCTPATQTLDTFWPAFTCPCGAGEERLEAYCRDDRRWFSRCGSDGISYGSKKSSALRRRFPDAALSGRRAVPRRILTPVLLLRLTWSEAQKVVVADYYAVRLWGVGGGGAIVHSKRMQTAEHLIFTPICDSRASHSKNMGDNMLLQ